LGDGHVTQGVGRKRKRKDGVKRKKILYPKGDLEEKADKPPKEVKDQGGRRRKKKELQREKSAQGKRGGRLIHSPRKAPWGWGVRK